MSRPAIDRLCMVACFLLSWLLVAMLYWHDEIGRWAMTWNNY